jgi:photosystem II stability/assembly factor-like uncharacterized protein
MRALSPHALILSLACCLHIPVQAQMPLTKTGWQDPLDTPAPPTRLLTKGQINAIARLGQQVIAAGARGKILYSTDSGKQWLQARVPVSTDLVAIAFGDTRNAWAVGHDSVILHSADGGQNWVKQLDGRSAGLLLEAGRLREAEAVHASDPDKAAAITEDAHRLRTQTIESSFLDVWFESAQSGYVVGAFGAILRTSDAGKTWSSIASSTDNPKGLHFYAVRGVNGDVFLAGEQGLLLKLDRQSAQFTSISLPYKGTLFGMNGDRNALVTYGLGGNVLRSIDGGQNWVQVNSGVTAGLVSSTFTDDGRLVIATQLGSFLVSNNSGQSFVVKNEPNPAPSSALIAVSNDSVLAVGPKGVRTSSLR